MLKKLITLSAALSIFSPAIASNPSDQLVEDPFFWGSKYVYGEGPDNNLAKFEEGDKVYLTPDAWLYVLTSKGQKRMVKGCRYGQNGTTEEGQPKMEQYDWYSFIRFGSATDNITNHLKEPVTAKVWGETAKVFTKDGEGKDQLVQEYFYLYHTLVPGFFERNKDDIKIRANLNDTTK